MNKARVILALMMIGAVGLSMAGCSQKKLASNITSDIFIDGAAAMEAQEDVSYTQDSLISMIQMLEVFQRANPKNKNYNFLLARSYGNYAYAFLEQDILDTELNKESPEYQAAYARADRFYQKGRDYGLAVLNQHESFKKAITGDLDSLKKALNRDVSRKDLPVLYWTAFNWANWVNLHKDSPLAVATMPKIEAMMAHVLALDPAYFYGSPHQFYGAYYASRPAMLGGDLGKSKAHFEQAIALTQEKFLLAKVAYAQYYAVAAQDQALFDRLLNEVLATDPGVLPEQRLANEVAVIRAKGLLEKTAQYF